MLHRLVYITSLSTQDACFGHGEERGFRTWKTIALFGITASFGTFRGLGLPFWDEREAS